MKRRREIGPKIQKNSSSLIKFLLLALVAAVLGTAAVITLYTLIGPAPEKEDAPSFIYLVAPMVLTVTILAVLALVFFGVRAYLSGSKSRHTLQRSRMKVKR